MNKKLKIFGKIFNRKIFGIFWKNRKNFGQKKFFLNRKNFGKIEKNRKNFGKKFFDRKNFCFFWKNRKNFGRFMNKLWTKIFSEFLGKTEIFSVGKLWTNYEQKKEQMFVFNCEQIVNKLWTNYEQKKNKCSFWNYEQIVNKKKNICSFPNYEQIMNIVKNLTIRTNVRHEQMFFFKYEQIMNIVKKLTNKKKNKCSSEQMFVRRQQNMNKLWTSLFF